MADWVKWALVVAGCLIVGGCSALILTEPTLTIDDGTEPVTASTNHEQQTDVSNLRINSCRWDSDMNGYKANVSFTSNMDGPLTFNVDGAVSVGDTRISDLFGFKEHVDKGETVSTTVESMDTPPARKGFTCKVTEVSRG